MNVLGRAGGDGPVGRLGRYRAGDGSDGAPVAVDLDRPHVGVVVGKRGHGKTHTLGVVAEGAARARGVAPVVVDPMGALAGLAEPAAGDPVPARTVDTPQIEAGTIPPPAWPELVGVGRAGAAGSLIERAAVEADTLAGMEAWLGDAPAAAAVRRAAVNHLHRAADWGVFAPDGLTAAALCGGEATVLRLDGYDPAPANAVVRAVARALYDARIANRVDRLPWLLIDEAHAAFGGVAAPALRRVATRGRALGVTLVVATQRPGALPTTAISQADLLVAHRLTAAADVDALAGANPTYLDGEIRGGLPTDPGCALVVDDTTETAHRVRVRERDTPHGGDSPRAADAGA